MLHKNIGVGDRHPIHDFEFANAAARTAYVYSASDVGKEAFQLDNTSFWRITAVTTGVATFKEIGGSTDISGKQDTLVSGTNIKTVNSTSLLGSGDIVISGITGTGSVDNRLLRSSGTAGNALDASVITVDDAGEIYGYAGQIKLITDPVDNANYTLNATDTGKILEFNNTSGVNVYLPNTLPKGFCCTCCQINSGAVTFNANAGATLNSYTSKTKIAGQYAAVTIWVRSNSTGTNAVYVIAGAMA